MKSGKQSNDAYYTKHEVAALCYHAIRKYVKIKKHDLIIEPSAGDGSFIPLIKKLSKNHIFYDIKPKHPDIKKQNFLTIKNKSTLEPHIIGNPPFGNKAASAIKFIKKTASLNAKSISFILPISFKKNSFKKSFPSNYHMIYQATLPENSFTYKNKSKNIKTVFQIWTKKPYHRKMPKKLHPVDWYKFVKKPDCNLAIRRVGFSVGKVKKCSADDNSNTNWFLQLKHPVNIDILNTIKFDKTRNVGAYSVSKQDIIKKYNRINIWTSTER